MGLTRKLLSLSTLGAVDMRSDKERIARKTAKVARYAKRSAAQDAAQTALLANQNKLLERLTPPTAAPAAVTVEARLAELDRLVERSVITGVERDAARSEILRGL
jgi:hypothetical protein